MRQVVSSDAARIISHSRAKLFSFWPFRWIESRRSRRSRSGEKRVITILSCDLAGFGEISEVLDPEDLLKVLNEYLDLGASVITSSRGYVDRCVGDAITAFWGAPQAEPRHPLIALESALLLSERVGEKFPSLRVRIGLHMGEAIVGTIGGSGGASGSANRRRTYTALGYSVDLASRLSGLCHPYGLQLLVSEATIRSSLGSNFNWQNRIAFEVDHVNVEGHTKSLKIFGFATRAQAALVVFYGEGLRHYYQGQFADGLRYFEMCEGLPPAKEMLARCYNAIVHGSAAKDWNEGVWMFDL